MNVINFLEAKLRGAEYGNVFGVKDMEFTNMLYSIITNKYNKDDAEMLEHSLDRYSDFEAQGEPVPEVFSSSSTIFSSPE